MYQKLEIDIPRNNFTSEEIQILKTKYLDNTIVNFNRLSKNQILEKIRNFRDELDRFA